MLNRKGFEKTDAGRIKIRFVMVLNVSKEIFGKFAFRRMPDLCKRRPISKALFETWTCILAECTEEELDSLVERKKNLIEKYRVMCLEDGEFIDSIGSGKVSSVKRRFEKIYNLVKEIVK